MSDLKQFNPEDAMKNIKDRIKSSFVEMIPDEQWQEMVKKEINDFLYQPKDRGHNYNHVKLTDFQVMVNVELERLAREKFITFLNTQFNGFWNTTTESKMMEIVKEFMVKNAGKMLFDMFSSMLQNSMYQITQNLNNNPNMHY